jgi:tRNA dimethylallyltransferase
LHRELAARAPAVAATIDPRDRHRVVRALELEQLGALAPREENRLWTRETRHPTRLVGLVRDRDDLRERIGARVAAMVAAGAREEVLAADAAGASETARQALGFGELLAGDVEAMTTRTRRYAKRQLTWLRKLPDVELVDLTGREPQDVAAELVG